MKLPASIEISKLSLIFIGPVESLVYIEDLLQYNGSTKKTKLPHQLGFFFKEGQFIFIPKIT